MVIINGETEACDSNCSGARVFSVLREKKRDHESLEKHDKMFKYRALDYTWQATLVKKVWIESTGLVLAGSTLDGGGDQVR